MLKTQYIFHSIDMLVYDFITVSNPMTISEANTKNILVDTNYSQSQKSSGSSETLFVFLNLIENMHV